MGTTPIPVLNDVLVRLAVAKWRHAARWLSSRAQSNAASTRAAPTSAARVGKRGRRGDVAAPVWDVDRRPGAGTGRNVYGQARSTGMRVSGGSAAARKSTICRATSSGRSIGRACDVPGTTARRPAGRAR